jgi:hypothetical protein
MTDELERKIRARLHAEAEEVGMSSTQRHRIVAAAGTGTGSSIWLQAPAIVAFAVGASLLLLAIATHLPQGAPHNPAAAVSTATPSAAASAGPLDTPAASPRSPASPSPKPFGCGSATGTLPGVANEVVAVRVSHQAGYDRLVFELAGPGTPGGAITYDLATKHSTSFTEDPRGGLVQVGGTTGAQLTLRNAVDMAPPPAQDLKPGYPTLVEVREVGNFEAVNSWAIGLNGTGCYRLQVFTSPTRVVLDWQVP